MNDSLIDKILLGGAVVCVLAAAAFFGVSRIDWAPATVATGDVTPTATTSGDVQDGTPEPTSTAAIGPDGEVIPTATDAAVEPTVSEDASEPAPTATPFGQRARVNTDYLLLTPADAMDDGSDSEEYVATEEPYFEPTLEVFPTEVLSTPDAAEATLPANEFVQPTDVPMQEETAVAEEPTIEETPVPDSGESSSREEYPTKEVFETAVPTLTPTPTVPPMDVVRGVVSWTGLRAVTKDVLVPAGAQLIIEPNTTLKISAGVSIYVDGTLRLNGTKAQPVYVTNENGTAQPWGGVYVREDAEMTVNDAYIWNGGAAGTLVAVERGTLRIADSELKNNRGQIRLSDAIFSLQKSTVRDNDLAFGAMVDASYSANGSMLFEYSRIGPNTGGSGTVVAIDQSDALSQVQLDMTGANLVGTNGTNMTIISKGTVTGALQCTTFHGGDSAVRVDSSGPSVPGIGVTIHQSVFSGHRAPYGPPRVVVSNVGIDARYNWWNAASGPYHPKQNPGGTGEANGVNVTATGWLTVRPPCAPVP
ncbi:MAG: hypothetical protein RLY87_926 [Chloroflexota bacterium]